MRRIGYTLLLIMFNSSGTSGATNDLYAPAYFAAQEIYYGNHVADPIAPAATPSM